MIEKILEKGVLLLLFCLPLLSCSKSCREWELSTIKATYPCATYAKARLAPQNIFNGIETEFLIAGKDATIFLNAFTLCFPASDDDDGIVEVDLAIEEQSYRFLGERLTGGQRIKLPEDAKQLIITSLLECRSIVVSVGRFQTEIVPGNFEDVYKEVFIEYHFTV